MGSGDRSQRPGGAPAVAVEHRKGPQVAGTIDKPLVDDLAQRIQIGAAMSVDNTLWLARCSGGVIQADRGVLVGNGMIEWMVITSGQQIVVAGCESQFDRFSGLGRK